MLRFVSSGTSGGSPLFAVDNGRFVPAPETRSPWGPDSLHAGAPGALLARAVEEHNQAPDLRVVRMTFDLLRPVPVQPLGVTVETVRPGRRVTLVQGELEADGQTCVRMTAWL